MKHIELQRVAPADIEARSMELIGQELGERVFPAEQLPVVKRVIHTTADFEYAANLAACHDLVEGAFPPGRWRRASRPYGRAAPSSPTPRWPSPG